MRVRSDLRMLAVALESYRAEHGGYPPSTFDRSLTAMVGIPPTNVDQDVPFMVGPAGAPYMLLTTPVPYLDSTVREHFPPDRTNTGYAYFSDGQGYMIFSPGPDHRYNVRNPKGFVSDVDLMRKLALLQYDASNGTFSAGDIIRTHQGTP